MTKITKPSEAELSAIEVAKVQEDGVTAYAVTRVVNEWLVADGLDPIASQRVYTQFAKKVAKSERLGARFTDAGAQYLAAYVYKYVREEQTA